MGGTGSDGQLIGGEVLGIPKGVTGKEKDAAIALAQYLMSKPAQGDPGGHERVAVGS